MPLEKWKSASGELVVRVRFPSGRTVIAYDASRPLPMQPGSRSSSSGGEPCGTCREPEASEPTWLQKAAKYSGALARWLAAGRPLRSPAEVLERLAICQRCPELRDAGSAQQRCGACGCPVNDHDQVPSVLGVPRPDNKLLLATESCPLGHWS